ncbi:hypothetical protein EG240_04580 [Paenimyroides tangerinum]|uniref:Uncharacterized protein n=1 Tax=Paenimyroides tangerinum TaxID=2488728 RepID=A0A3P3WDY4_9FLAO|nr:hypothetical protein [Paenimyroides tangerinum]RRJ91839.1 hypothetical protein EG240_04580 [Paenimyroides tangerinum]
MHIYTYDLYGQNIRIELKENGKTLKANSYEEGFVINSHKDNAKSKGDDNAETTYEINESEDFFYSEIDIYQFSKDDVAQPPLGATIGYLIDPSKENDNEQLTKKKENNIEIIKTSLSVQKAVLTFFIDPAWFKNQHTIVIHPTIHFFGKAVTLNCPLRASLNVIPDFRMPEMGNKPVFVDNVETNIEAFQPCRYNFFKVNDGSREVDLIEDKSIPPINVFELVAGTVNNTSNISISLDTDTTKCNFEGTPIDHEGRVIEIIEYPEKVFEGITEKEEKSSISGSSFLNVQIGGKKTNVSSKTEITLNKSLEVYTKTDKELKFKARFIYDYSPIKFWSISVNPIFRYFWLGEGVPSNTYKIQTHTCGWQHAVAIKTYPDVTWNLKLSYKNSKIEKELINNQRYKDTNNAKFKREPQKWTSSKDRSIGISLSAT